MEIKSWGVALNDSIPRAAGWDCQNKDCGWKCAVLYRYWYDNIVGYEHDSCTGEGKVIIECPCCFEKFWFHFDAKECHLPQKCPNWPK